MKRVLILASVASAIEQFNIPNIELLISLGYQVDVACNFKKGNTCTEGKVLDLKRKLDEMNVNYYQIDFSRKITNINQNVKAFRQTEFLLKKNSYFFVHCHTPIAGVAGRIVGKKCNTKVIYTAHGFHFYKGAPLINWMLYYPIEKICSNYTDVLICINKEDFALAKRKMKAKKIEYIPGVGVKKYANHHYTDEIKTIRKSLDIPEKAIVLISVGELNANKNHSLVINALKSIDNSDVYYLIAGQGKLKSKLVNLAEENGISKHIRFLGFRSDVIDLMKASDIFVFQSFREGLSVSLMEAMSSGLPVVCSEIRGNVDLIDKNGGILFDPNSVSQCSAALRQIIESTLKQDMGAYNEKKVEQFSLDVVLSCMRKIYTELE